jgi:uncharacterized protein (TIGR02246 family)
VTRAELLQILVGGAAAGAAPSAALAAASAEPGLAARLDKLEARAEIHELMMAYGRTLDRRDFAGFADLWAPDAEYVQGAGAAAKGPSAIRALLEKAFATNAAGVKGPNFHVFFNEAIGPVEADRATAFSRSAFVAAGVAGLEVVVTAHYDDIFVRRDGRWKFLRRVIVGDQPAPRAAGR